MIQRLRRNGVHRFVAIALIAFMSSAPVYAGQPDDANFPAIDEAPQSERVADIQAAIADIEDPILREIYESIGQGEASYYGSELAGNRTASGERFDPRALTAAHRSLPMGTKLRVTNLSNGMSVVVRVNDRGPFVRSRIIDVSLAAARQIRMVGSGRAQVRLEILRTIA
jgi:rare lipoprotein A